MTHVFEPAVLAEEMAFDHRRRTSRTLVLWLALSLTLHLAMLFGLPGFAVSPEPMKTQILDVVVQRESTPQVSAEAGVKIPPAPRDHPVAAKIPKVARHLARRDRKPELEPISPAAVAGTARDAYPVRPTLQIKDEKPPSALRNAGSTTPTRSIAAASPPGFHAGYLRNPPPPYPLVARRNGEQGKVILRVLVTRGGLPASVDIEKTSRSSHLDDAALETVKTWRFVPARQNGQPVDAWVLVPIVFRLEGTS
jgi:protein TonB